MSAIIPTTTETSPIFPTAGTTAETERVNWVVNPVTPSKKKVTVSTTRYTRAEVGRVRTGHYTGLTGTANQTQTASAQAAASSARQEARRIIADLGEITGNSPFAMPGTAIAEPPRRAKAAAGSSLVADIAIDSTRTQIIKSLALARLQCGRNTSEDLGRAAIVLGLSIAHVRRLVTEMIVEQRVRPATDRPKITVPDLWQLKVAYFAAAGNAALAYETLTPEALGGMSLRSYQRYLAKEMDPALRAAAKGGHRAMVKHQIFSKTTIPHRAYSYSIDHTDLPIQAIPARGHRPFWVTMTVVSDTNTDLVLAFKLADSQPNAQTTIDVLAEAIQGWTTPDGHFIGGKPLFLRSDNGGDFISEALNAHLVHLEVDHQFTQPYSSWQNKVERINKIIDEEFAPQIYGFCAGGADAYSRRIDRLPVDPNSLLTLEMLHLVFQKRFDALNNRPRKSKNGRSALDLWIAQDDGGYQPPKATKDEIVYAMSPRSEHRLQTYGIDARRFRYQTSRLGELKRNGVETVEIRYHDSDIDHVEVFVDGVWQCTADRVLKENEVAGIISRRRAQNEEVRALQSAAEEERARRMQDEIRETGMFSEEEIPSVPDRLYAIHDVADTSSSGQADPDAAFDLAMAALGIADSSPCESADNPQVVTDPSTGLPVNPSTGEISA